MRTSLVGVSRNASGRIASHVGKRHALPLKNLLPALCMGLATLGLVSCSWGIKLDPAGKTVRTAWDGNVAGCREVGKLSVSVLDHVGPMDRNDIKVRDELEVMARNEAAEMHADTIVPLGEPRDGSQRWTAYVCGPQTSPPAQVPAPTDDGVQTYPIKND